MNTFDLSFSGTGALILFLGKATLLLVAALLATASLRRSTAGARHLVWLAALVGVLALPLLSRIPSLKLAVLPNMFGSTPAAVAPVPDQAVTLFTPALAQSPIAERARISGNAAPVVAGVTTAVARGETEAVTGGVAGGVSDFLPALASSGYSLLSTIAIAWAFVALVFVGWLVAGAMYVRRIVTRATELTSPDWTMPLCEVADRLDLEVPPRIVLSDRIEMAFACRALAPTIVLPASAEEWTDDRRRAVLFHELAHIKRHDLLGHTLGRLACALYWFHPLVWTAAKRLRAESERACDDLVLSCGARPSEYAQHLLDMVTNVRDHGAPLMALPMARKKEFEGRMLAILDPAIRRASPGRLQAAAVITTLGVLSLTVAAVSPVAATPASVQQASAPPVSERQSMALEAPTLPPLSQSSQSRSPAHPPAYPTPTPTPAPSPSPAPTSPQGLNVDVKTTPKGLSATVSLDGIMEMAGAAINGALKSSAAQIRSQMPLQSADTGRIALMIKVLGTDTDASVRRTAAWALHEIETTDVRGALATALHADADARVREMAAWALGEQGSPASGSVLSDALLHDKNAHVRATAAWALGESDTKSEIAALESGMSDAEPEVRESSIWAIGEIGVRIAPKSLTNALTDASRQIRIVAAWALAEIEDKSTAPAVVAAFKTETDPQVRAAELRALGAMGQVSADVVDVALKSPDPEVRRRAVAMLAGDHFVEPWPWPRPQPRPQP